MRRWMAVAAAAGAAVADRPLTWLPGALAWLCTIGWLPFVIGVAQPPSLSDLTFLGARFYGSSLWPWNLALLAAGVTALTATTFTLAAVAEATLLDMLSGTRRRLSTAWRMLGIGSVLAIPAAVMLLVLAVALVNVAPDEFSSPDRGAGPIVRTLVAVAPILVLLAAVVTLASAFHAAAVRLVHHRGADVGEALEGSARLLRSAGAPALVQLVVATLARVALVVVAAVLLRVLWVPVGELLAIGERDALTIGLLVGFVAIWLCLVLVAGALHAWGSAAWSILLTGPATGREAERTRQETPLDR